MITNRDIRRDIDDAESKLKECWEILCSMQTRPTIRIFQFQPLLAEVLHQLSTRYVAIAAERRHLIDRKALVNPTWFGKRLARLAHHQQLLESVITIGKSMGDAFAWFFYQNDPNLLREHEGNQRQRILATGIGGQGELAFIRDLRAIRGKMVLHHGITSMLRIGDVSLIDLRGPRVAGIGEIKTAETNGELVVHVEFLLRKDLDIEATWEFNTHSADDDDFEFSPKIKERLKRQMDRLAKVVKSRPETPHNWLVDDATHTESVGKFVLTLTPNRMSYHVLEMGLLIAGTRTRSRSLFKRLNRSSNLPDDIDDGAGHVMQIMVPGSRYNRLVVSSIHYSDTDQIHTLAGAAPLFWWGLPVAQVFDILFCRVQLLSLYNPAPFVESLISLGFEVVEDPGHPYLMRLQRARERSVRLENLWYFMNLTCQFMFRTERVVQIVSEFIRLSESAVGDAGGKINWVFNHRPFAPPAGLTDILHLTAGPDAKG